MAVNRPARTANDTAAFIVSLLNWPGSDRRVMAMHGGRI
jgi:hypothetical protein